MDPIKVNRGSKRFFLLFISLLILSVSAAFYKYIVIEDYEVFVVYDEDGNLVDTEAELKDDSLNPEQADTDEMTEINESSEAEGESPDLPEEVASSSEIKVLEDRENI